MVSLQAIILCGILLPCIAGHAVDYIGCYGDKKELRAMKGKIWQEFGTKMTTEKCIMYCVGHGYMYAGTQFGHECFCDDSYDIHGLSTKCTKACSGNPNEICGGHDSLSVHRIHNKQIDVYLFSGITPIDDVTYQSITNFQGCVFFCQQNGLEKSLSLGDDDGCQCATQNTTSPDSTVMKHYEHYKRVSVTSLFLVISHVTSEKGVAVVLFSNPDAADTVYSFVMTADTFLEEENMSGPEECVVKCESENWCDVILFTDDMTCVLSAQARN